MVAADWLREFAEATGNPLVLSFGAHCLRFRFPRCKSRPRTRRSAPGPGTIAQDGGSPCTESILVLNLARLEAEHADPLARSITSRWQSAITTTQATPARCAPRWPSSPLSSTGSGGGYLKLSDRCIRRPDTRLPGCSRSSQNWSSPRAHTPRPDAPSAQIRTQRRPNPQVQPYLRHHQTHHSDKSQAQPGELTPGPELRVS